MLNLISERQLNRRGGSERDGFEETELGVTGITVKLKIVFWEDALKRCKINNEQESRYGALGYA